MLRIAQSQLYATSELTIEENSKIGTIVNGTDKVKKETRVLKGNKHELKLGNWPHPLM
jgi:hypothetical protein